MALRDDAAGEAGAARAPGPHLQLVADGIQRLLARPTPRLRCQPLQHGAQRVALELQRPGDGRAQLGHRQRHRRGAGPLQRLRGTRRQLLAAAQQPAHVHALAVAEGGIEQRRIVAQRDAAQDHRRVDERTGQRRRQHRAQRRVDARYPVQRIAPGDACGIGRAGRQQAAHVAQAVAAVVRQDLQHAGRGAAADQVARVEQRPACQADRDRHAGTGLAGMPAQLLGRPQRGQVKGQRLVAGAGDDLDARTFGRRMLLADQALDPEGLGRQVQVVRAGADAGRDHGVAGGVIRPGQVDQHLRAPGQRPHRGGVARVGHDELRRPRRRQLLHQRLQTVGIAPGDAPVGVGPLAQQRTHRLAAGEAGGAEQHQIQPPARAGVGLGVLPAGVLPAFVLPGLVLRVAMAVA